jgi:K(+)-stimulated pyrophosphate-energized sodium pump
MVLPGVIAVSVPWIVGFGIGPEALGGLLAGALLGCVLLALTMANAGGAWDNAKKWIEKGGLAEAFIAEGKYKPEEEGEKFGEGKKKYAKYMKGSPEHKAAVTGDTVGDPFKDTSGPSMNILVKLMSMVAVATVALVMFVNNGNGILPWLFEVIFTSGK